jgi:hypothetical protein
LDVLENDEEETMQKALVKIGKLRKSQWKISL